jgi:hypothetical protein
MLYEDYPFWSTTVPLHLLVEDIQLSEVKGSTIPFMNLFIYLYIVKSYGNLVRTDSEHRIFCM